MANILGKEYTRAELLKRVGDISQIGGIRSCILNDGRTKGVLAYEMNTGCIKITVLPDRCMDIADTSYMGVPFSWISKTGVTSPSYFEHNGKEFLRGFYGGMLTTCGMRNTGISCVCDGESFGLHGRIGNIPAKNVSASEYWQDNQFVMKISGQMRESKVFGENLLLRREVTANLGGSSFSIKDTVMNEGFQKEEVLLLYHMNFGFPLLDNGAKIVVPKGKVVPATKNAADDIEHMCDLYHPKHGYTEECFFVDFENEDIHVGIQNPHLCGFNEAYIKYKKSQLPWFTIWKMLGESEYVVGMEPGLQYPMGRLAAKKGGFTTSVEPFEEFTIELEVGVR